MGIGLHCAKLLSIASEPLADQLNEADVARFTSASQSSVCEQLLKVLSVRNGFYAFEGALHFFPVKAAGQLKTSYELVEWNSHTLWRNWYGDLVSGALFFAEDVFGVQFAIVGGRVALFDPEAGEFQDMAEGLEQWAEKLLANYEELTGFQLAHAWQRINGAIRDKNRLLPKIPFVLGGGYSVDNLISLLAEDGMKYRGEMWQQIKNLPDGAQVRLMPLPTH